MLEITRLLKDKYRVVDLTEHVAPMAWCMPGQTRARLYHLRQFSYPAPGGEWMHQITMESHIGTHIEGPSHWTDAFHNRPGVGRDLSQVPLEMYFGEAILVKTDELPDNAPITPEFLEKEGVRKDDIVIMGLSGRDPDVDPKLGAKTPYLSDEAVEWLASLPIKMIAFDRTTMWGLENRVRLGDPKRTPQTVRGRFENMMMHRTFLGGKGQMGQENTILVIEVIGHLDRLTKKRFFFCAWPALLGGVDSFPIRCVAFEPEEGGIGTE